ncbi:large subunit of U2 snRNP auxiliary factor [Chloropicon primus]|uniref:Splicing factor U2af large subunit n=1 Tax=Chloropicon primus TaxID=1764295 RepID=A0A5B8MHE0_9CHLO|nr:large subunit of U2 snRNP auxiliary factor [Chloropicon primus]|eukprot:QDZ19886.1 large subunit of U2 snRNP auxiliary factor [Chloropicon primus]
MDRERARERGYRRRSRSRSPSERRDRDRDRGRDRDRDRGRDRSYSPRSRSRSRSRSPGYSDRRRERRRQRVSGFDQGPPNGGRPGYGPPGGFPPRGAPGYGPSSATGNPNPYQAQQQPPRMQTQATRHARRVYVGALPNGLNDQMIGQFFGQALQAVGGTKQPGSPVVNVYFNMEKKFSFVEFRTVEECSNAMALDGIYFEGNNIRVRRPNDYNPAMAASLGPSAPSPNLNLDVVGLKAGGYVSPSDSPDRIFIGGLPYYLEEQQIRELLGQFGSIMAFDLVKDKETGNSKGYGFVVYDDPSVTDAACSGLNGLRMGDKTLSVRRAAEGLKQRQQQAQQQAEMAIAMAMGRPPAQQHQHQQHQHQKPEGNPTAVVRLSNCVTIAELEDPEEYEEIVLDMKEEAGKYGDVASLVIPKPSPTETVDGLGKVFVKYREVSHAVAACQAMNGRKFGGNVVVADYMDEIKFDQRAFS